MSDCLEALRPIPSSPPRTNSCSDTCPCAYLCLMCSNMGESVNTMRYAERAMNIQNTAVKNEDVSGPPVSYAEVRLVLL